MIDVNLARFSSHVLHIFEYIFIVRKAIKVHDPRHCGLEPLQQLAENCIVEANNQDYLASASPLPRRRR